MSAAGLQRIQIVPNLSELCAFADLELLGSKDLVNGVLIALEGGLESKSLIILAGESQHSSVFDLLPLLKKSLNELCLKVPDEKLDALMMVAHFYAKAIIQGAIPPHDGANLIHYNVTHGIGSPSNLLYGFLGCVSEINDVLEDENATDEEKKRYKAEQEEEIRKLARELLAINCPAALVSDR